MRDIVVVTKDPFPMAVFENSPQTPRSRVVLCGAISVKFNPSFSRGILLEGNCFSPPVYVGAVVSANKSEFSGFCNNLFHSSSRMLIIEKIIIGSQPNCPETVR